MPSDDDDNDDDGGASGTQAYVEWMKVQHLNHNKLQLLVNNKSERVRTMIPS